VNQLHLKTRQQLELVRWRSGREFGFRSGERGSEGEQSEQRGGTKMAIEYYHCV
jgi:hypothetical protein